MSQSGAAVIGGAGRCKGAARSSRSAPAADNQNIASLARSSTS